MGTNKTKIEDETTSSLSESLDSARLFVDYLIRKKREDAGWLGILTCMLIIFFGVISIYMVNFLTDNSATKYFIENPSSSFIYCVSLVIGGSLLGLAIYFQKKNQYIRKFAPMEKDLNRLKKTIWNHDTEKIGVVEETLRLMDQISELLPEIVRYRTGEAFTYGLVTFLLVGLGDARIGLLAGLVVWLYFRHEKREEAEKEIQKFKVWKTKLSEGREYLLKEMCERRPKNR
jgi:uncharacterized membrane-anchored protein